MPSIFTALERIIQGKPVFDANDQAMQQGLPMQQVGQPPVAGAEQPDSSIVKHSAGTFPVVYVKRSVTRVNGDDIQVYLYIDNNWNDTVELRSINMLGRTEKVEVGIPPGQEHEVLAYEGPNFKSAPQAQIELDYETESGDYFASKHDVIFHFNPDQTYTIQDVRLHLPICDIYE